LQLQGLVLPVFDVFIATMIQLQNDG